MADIVGAMQHATYQPEALAIIFNGENRHLTLEDTSWVYFYVSGMLNESTFNLLNALEQEFCAWNLRWCDWKEWYPEAIRNIPGFNVQV